MQVFLHRANTEKEIDRALDLGIGIEVDIRTVRGVAYLSHDPIIDCYVLERVEDALWGLCATPVLLDFKETGITDIVKRSLTPWMLDKALCIDLIAPDMYYAQSIGFKTLVRSSKYEAIAPYSYSDANMSAGIWLDYKFSFEELSSYSCPAYLVSPELHGRDLTDDFIELAVLERSIVGVCTDYPERWLEAIGK